MFLGRLTSEPRFIISEVAATFTPRSERPIMAPSLARGTNQFFRHHFGHALAALKRQDFVPDLIIIDTLARSMVVGNESATEDMSKVFDLIDMFRRELKEALPKETLPAGRSARVTVIS